MHGEHASARPSRNASLDAFIAAAQTPGRRRDRVAKYMATVSGWAWSGVTLTVIQANGLTSAQRSRGSVVVMFFTIEASPEGIDQIM